MCLPTVHVIKVNLKTKSAERKIFLTSYCTVSGLVLHWLILDSVQFIHSVVSASLRPHEPQHARPPCPSTTPGVYPNPRPLSWWCHPTISSSIIPFSSCPQSFPASGSFQMSQLFTLGGQSIRVSVSWSVLSMNTEDWSSLGWTGWISLQSKGLSRVFSNTTVQKHQFSGTQLSLSEKAMAAHSSTLACKIQWMEGPGRLQSIGWLGVRHGWATSLSLFTFMHWRKKWHPTPVFLPGECQGGGSWWAAVYGVSQSQTQLKWLSRSSSFLYSPTLTSIHDHWKNYSLD